jgi:hypothetical protein
MATNHKFSILSGHVKEGEVLTSSELIQRLVKVGYSEQNARQIIRRHSNVAGVWRSSDLKLPRNERLFALTAFRNSPGFQQAVAQKLEGVGRNGLARCLSILARRSVMNKVDVMRTLAVSPASVAKAGQRAMRMYDSELAGMRELGVSVFHENTALESLVFADSSIDVTSQAVVAAQNLRKELVLARVLIDRMRQQNLIAWNQVEVPEPSTPYTVFNGQVFTASGFSYLSPVVRWKKGAIQPVPCPAVIDCHHDRCMLAQVRSFQQRIARAANRGQSRQHILGVIGARDFERDAWDEARSHGWIVVNFRQMFGDEALEVMSQIEQLIQEVSVDTETCHSPNHFDVYSKLVDELKNNPIVATLRAIGFETLSGLAMRSRGYDQVELGRIVPWKQTTRDVDAWGLRGDELRIIECKAYHEKKSVASGEVRKFFTETVPACKDWLRSTSRSFKQCTAEIWTTGAKGKEAGDVLYKLNRPKTDTWAICRIKEIKPLLPDSIRTRSLELLNSIATAQIDGSPTDG